MCVCVCEREEQETYFLAPDERQRKDTYTANTGPVLVSYNRALDRTPQAKSSLDWEQRGESMQCFPQPWRRDQESGLNLG